MSVIFNDSDLSGQSSPSSACRLAVLHMVLKKGLSEVLTDWQPNPEVSKHFPQVNHLFTTQQNSTQRRLGTHSLSTASQISGGNGQPCNHCQWATQRSKTVDPRRKPDNNLSQRHGLNQVSCHTISKFSFPLPHWRSHWRFQKCTERFNVKVCNFVSCVHFSQSFHTSN